jgi:hypothetical protein
MWICLVTIQDYYITDPQSKHLQTVSFGSQFKHRKLVNEYETATDAFQNSVAGRLECTQLILNEYFEILNTINDSCKVVQRWLRIEYNQFVKN